MLHMPVRPYPRSRPKTRGQRLMVKGLTRYANFLPIGLMACALLFEVSLVHADEPLHLRKVHMSPSGNNKFKSTAGTHARLDIGNANDPARPALWDSDIMISQQGRPSCTTRNYLLQKMYADDGNEILLIVHSSGASTYLSLVGFDCTEKFPSQKVITNTVSVINDKLISSAVCIKLNKLKHKCYSANVFNLSKTGGFELDTHESTRVTKETLGVELVGSKAFDNKDLPDRGYE
jgi:hypothetical protein